MVKNLKTISFSGLDSQLEKNRSDINKALKNVLDSCQFIMGKEIETLEQKLASFFKIKYAVTCANGTDAITLSLMAIDLKPGDFVIVPDFTFVSSIEAPVQLGIKPILVDINKDDFSINIEHLKSVINVNKKMGYKIKAIINVDLFGMPSDYSSLLKICKENNYYLISDAAQSFGTIYNNAPISNYADITTTSFFPSKPLGCYGDGGCVFTKSKKIADKIKSLRLHGKGFNKYDNKYVGLNSRLDTIQAAILIEKLKVFPDELKKRKEIANFYMKNIDKKEILPKERENSQSVWSQFTIKTSLRDDLKLFLQKKKIPSAVYYPRPLHKQSAYKHFSNKNLTFCNSENASKRVLSIPIHGYLNQKQVKYITDVLNNFFGKE